MVEPIFDYQFRLILIGDSTVGKSSLLKSFTDGKFSEISDPTVGVDFFARLIELRNGLRIKLQLWDTAGQERFRSITRSYYRNSVGAMVVYDTCSRQSFEHVGYWVGEAKRHIAPHKAVFILVGAKVDLNEGRQVPVEEARALANFHNMLFMETSSKTGWHVEEAFREVAMGIYKRLENGEYQLEDGWDGIKGGYHTYSDYRIAEAEPTRPCC